MVILNVAVLALSTVSFFRPSFVLPTALCLIVCTCVWLYKQHSDRHPAMYPRDSHPQMSGSWDEHRMSRQRASSDVVVPHIADGGDIDMVMTPIRPPNTTQSLARPRSRDEEPATTSDVYAHTGGDEDDLSDSYSGPGTAPLHAGSPVRDLGEEGSDLEEDQVAALDLDSDNDSVFIDIGNEAGGKPIEPRWRVSVPASVAHQDPVNGVWYIINVTEVATGKTWAVSRRYAEFRALDQAIRGAVSQQRWTLVTLPILPPKSISKRSLSKRDIRREGLEAYLHHLTHNEYVLDNDNLAVFIRPRKPADPYLTVPIETTISPKITRKHAPVNAIYRVMHGLHRAAWRDEYACVLPHALRFLDCQDPRSSLQDIPLDEITDIVVHDHHLWEGPKVMSIRTPRLRVFVAAEGVVLDNLSASVRTAARDYTGTEQGEKGSSPPRTGSGSSHGACSRDGNTIVLNRQTLVLEPSESDVEELSATLLTRLLEVGNAEHGPGFTPELAASPAFASLAFSVSELQVVRLNGLSEDARVAFFLNVYHTLLLHALVDIGAPSSVMQRKSFYNNICYEVAGRLYSLADIEHGILRATSSKPALMFQSLFIPSIKSSDSRSRHALREPEPRVSFALNVGCVSSPDLIFVYRAATLDRQLEAAARVFCAASISIEGHRARVTLPRLLEWYAADFGPNKATMLRKLSSYLPNPEMKLLQSMVYVADASNIKITYRDFVWQFRTVFHLGDAEAIIAPSERNSGTNADQM